MRFLFLLFPIYIFAHILSIQINNIKNNKGYIYISIYKNSNNFLDKNKAYKTIILKSSTNLNYNLDLKSGVYAVSIFHDENSNGILDRNFFHFPKEGYGFSTNPFLFGKPTFSDAEFPLKDNQSIIIKMNY